MEKMKTFKPRGKWILINPDEAQETYGKSFIAADNPNKKPETGETIAIGRSDSGYKVGEKLFFQRNGSVQIEVDGESRVLVHENQILGSYE